MNTRNEKSSANSTNFAHSMPAPCHVAVRIGAIGHKGRVEAHHLTESDLSLKALIVANFTGIHMENI